MKKGTLKAQEETATNILKQLAKRMEDATVDIHSIKGNVAGMYLVLDTVKMDVKLIKSDVEKLRDENHEIKEELKETESRLDKRIEHVADLITVELGGKLYNHEKRIAKLEQVQIAP